MTDLPALLRDEAQLVHGLLDRIEERLQRHRHCRELTQVREHISAAYRKIAELETVTLPVEPSEAMIVAGIDAFHTVRLREDRPLRIVQEWEGAAFAACYRAMIAKAKGW